ncbi:MAG: sulfide dehydrogenase [flavocytochrome c] flavoprotein subunit [Glaciecola sp.]|jgi:sulfide dehydrogenase [flavocytochrome c] flavoprotein subunit|uniref:NAD(P)/FAD-dependent oxidoreductase n=1 Tax=Congregibacter sp. TaxID=2744308 RepID=UPI0039E2A31F
MVGRLHGQTSHRVVVVGGGFAGSTFARYLSLWGGSDFSITMVDPREGHSSCVMSNLVLTKQLSLAQLTFSHEPLAGRFGFDTVIASVSNIDAGDSGVHGSPTVVVLDANSGIQAEKATFTAAFNNLYGDVIQYVPNAELLSVDALNRGVETTAGAYACEVLNVIPNHRAPALLRDAGLTDGGSWALVDPVTFESRVPGLDDIYVIGDAQATGQPKSAHMANAQAKVCADAILRKASGSPTHSTERLANVTTNSACFSPVSFNEAAWLTAVFRYNQTAQAMELAPNSLGASEGWDRESYGDMYDWANNLFSDTFV